VPGESGRGVRPGLEPINEPWNLFRPMEPPQGPFRRPSASRVPMPQARTGHLTADR
jgi:hypothetical protein